MTPAEGGDPAPQRYRLPTGWLDLRIQGQQLPHELFRIAARQNPKRGFLFVSTVLGRHIPVRPSLHREVLRHLASACLPHLPEGPILVMGFAETAIGLGAGVAQEIARHRPGASYLPTTRHPVPGQGWLGFSEPHSHASAHEIMRPAAEALPGGPGGLTLVLVDDEMTTGTTVANLVTALQTGGLQPTRILLVTLTDWSGGRAAALVTARSAIPDVRSVSLMQGGWHWTQDESCAPDQVPALEGASPIPAWTARAGAAFAAPRLGISGFATASVASRLTIAPFRPKDRVLVIGSGEHVWQPFLLAEEIEAMGCQVGFCATTRSPIHPGETITAKLTFPDHFGIGIPMYLHNFRRTDWDRVILMTETGIDGIAAALAEALSPCEIIDGAGHKHSFGMPE